MFKRIIIITCIYLLSIFYGYASATSAESGIAENAAEYICSKAKENNKKRLAVYSFTNDDGEISPKSRLYSTKIISLILEKNEFKIIDPDSLPEVIKEQEKGLTGLVDTETVAETGKLTGADTLIFGIAGDDTLQVRMVDAETGVIIGATLEEKSGKTVIKNNDLNSAEGRKLFTAGEFTRNLKQIHDKYPFLYLYITSDENELAELEKTFPDAMNRLKSRIYWKNPKDNFRFERRRKRLADFRNQNPAVDNRIRKSRKNLIQQLKEKRRKK